MAWMHGLGSANTTADCKQLLDTMTFKIFPLSRLMLLPILTFGFRYHEDSSLGVKCFKLLSAQRRVSEF
jgi:hypothetical protein